MKELVFLIQKDFLLLTISEIFYSLYCPSEIINMIRYLSTSLILANCYYDKAFYSGWILNITDKISNHVLPTFNLSVNRHSMKR